MQVSRTEFFKRTVIVVAVAVIPILVWYLFDVILVAFGAVILAMLVRLGAQPFMRWASVPEPLAFSAAALSMSSKMWCKGRHPPVPRFKAGCRAQNLAIFY
jgi:hypothetical protein